MFSAPATVFRGEPSVLIPGERAFDEDWVERRTKGLRAGNRSKRGWMKIFCRTHRIARQEA
jgi:hypothetical protein